MRTFWGRVGISPLLVVVAILSAEVITGAERPLAIGRAAPGDRISTVAHHAGGERVGSSHQNGPWTREFRLGMKAGEPTLGTTRNGDVFYTAIQDNFRIEVLRSRTAGRKWQIVSPRFPTGTNAHLVSFDPYLYVDRDTDRVYNVDLTVACSYLSFSDDGGESWTTNPLACGRPVNDHQTLFSGPPAVSAPVGYPNVVYYCWNDVATSSCTRSLDGGMTFSPTGSPAFIGFDPEASGDNGALGHCGGIHGHGVVGRDGTVYLPREFCGRPFLGISHDEGATWDRVQVASNGSEVSDPSVALDKEGNIYYAWVAKDRLPYLTISRDGGKGWTKPMMIGSPGLAEASLLTVDAGDPGGIAFAYMGTENRRFPKSWNGYIGMSANALGRNPLFHSGTVNGSADPLKRGTCDPRRCGEQILDFIDVVIARDGTAWASFVDACTGACVNGSSDQGNEGVVGHLGGGPKLR